MKTSRQHHIFPIFYLKGFANGQGRLAVYDKGSYSIEKDFRYPSTRFFEWDRNSVMLNGKLDDFPEKAYSLIDSHTALIFKKIQQSHGVPRLSNYESQGLRFFVSDLFWRNPNNDKHYEETFRETRLIKKIFSAIDSNTGQTLSKDIPKHLLDDDEFLMKAFRPLAGPASFEQSSPNFTDWKICYSSIGNYICSDNPFLLANDEAKDIFDSMFVFPLTKHHLLIGNLNSNLPTAFPGEIIGLVQLALYIQAKKYCASSTKETLKLLSEVPQNNSLDYLKDRIFGFIEGFDNKG